VRYIAPLYRLHIGFLTLLLLCVVCSRVRADCYIIVDANCVDPENLCFSEEWCLGKVEAYVIKSCDVAPLNVAGKEGCFRGGQTKPCYISYLCEWNATLMVCEIAQGSGDVSIRREATLLGNNCVGN
jgi:hypothetical protein